MHFRLPAVAGSLLVALALPASAHAAPTMEPLRPCYVTAGTAKKPQSEGVVIQAQGFTADSRVALTVDGAPLEGVPELQVDASGLLRLQEFPAPFVPPRVGTRDFSVTLTEVGNAANTVTSTAKATALAVGVKPRRARPSERIRFFGRGFTADKPVYAHYTRNGKQIRRVRMVRRTGECGSWSVRRPQFPMAEPTEGIWVVQFDQSKKFVNGAIETPKTVFVRVKFEITFG
jgi:hypothetical protein